MQIIRLYDEEEGCLEGIFVLKHDCYDLLNTCKNCFHGCFSELYEDNGEIIYYNDYEKIPFSNSYVEETLSEKEEDKKLLAYLKDKSKGNYGEFILEIRENGLYNFIKDILEYYEEIIEIEKEMEFYI